MTATELAEADSWLRLAGVGTVAGPAGAVAVLGTAAALGRNLGERVIHRCTAVAVAVGAACLAAVVARLAAAGEPRGAVEVGNWVTLPGYHLKVKLLFDHLSIAFAALSFALCGVIGAFAQRYMHREPGYGRFYLLYAVFLLGMVAASLAGTVETLFIGWELVGLSSALLVAFFQERPAPPRNGLRVWAVYRASDAALLLAAIALHHLRGEGDFQALAGTRMWPDGEAAIDAAHAFPVGLLLLVAAAGKSALVPFSGWLPRAMEGPTPSSAIFYGALSAHLGAYLLLRSEGIVDSSPALQALIVAVGLATAVHAAIVARVQTDVKSNLSYAALTQIGLIVAEIGLGLRYLALVHLIGHACVRTLQFLRAGSLLQDFRSMEDDLGGPLPAGPRPPTAAGAAWYRFALERGYFDAFLADVVVGPVLRALRWCDARDRAAADWLRGAPDPTDEPAGELEDLA